MKNNVLILLFFICACANVQAQINLVKNGGFEQKFVCPNDADLVKDAKYWSSIDTGYVSGLGIYYGNPYCSPEYTHICGTWPYGSLPLNANFYQYPRTGNGMFDVGMYDSRGDTITIGSASYHRDYLMGRLSSTLILGQSYCVTFYVVMSNRSGYAIDHIGAYLDNGSIDTVSHCGWPQMEYTPQVYATSILSDSVAWTKIQGSFISNGTEKYITIGNFFDTAHTHKIPMTGSYWSYYEVDDVSVIATGAHADAGPDKSLPYGDTAYIGVDSNGDGMPCYWYVMGGTSPIDSGGTIAVHPTVTTSYVVEMDLCGVVTRDTVTVTIWPLSNVEMWKYANVEIYPNPTMGELTIAHASGAALTVCAIVGKKVYSASISSDKEVVNIAALQKGVYLVQIIAPGTGQRITRKIIKE